MEHLIQGTAIISLAEYKHYQELKDTFDATLETALIPFRESLQQQIEYYEKAEEEFTESQFLYYPAYVHRYINIYARNADKLVLEELKELQTLRSSLEFVKRELEKEKAKTWWNKLFK